jgi:hypothetical protein
MKTFDMPVLSAVSLDAKLREYSTPATAAAAAVVVVTGVMMFFHVGKDTVEGMHEWLGMTFVAVAALHVVRHRRVFMKMLTQRRTHALLGIAVLAAGAFLVVPHGPNPIHRLADSAREAPLTALADVLRVRPAELVARLQAEGIQAPDVALSVNQIAASERIDPRRLLGAVLQSE